jgi:hypothetical protein
MDFTEIVATSTQLWISALVFLVIDLVLYWFLNRQISLERFKRMKWQLVLAAALFWGTFAVFLLQMFWDSYYQYIYPAWFRGAGILVTASVIYGTLALVFYWLSLRIPGNPVRNFLLLGAVESVLEHLWGILGVQILEVPMLREAGTIDIIVVAIPEYIFYWGMVIWIAMLLQRGMDWLKSKLGN